mmetsp:Transcript_10700/g.22311  ORF Transcript_10700/g.22311 Transcript_10700/m.22311 type:complete len:210 (-) Transcript_10700:427-1056(-)
MNAARDHHIFPKVIVLFFAQNRTIPTHTKFASHMAAIVNFQSSPPMMIPFTGYAKPFRTCVTKTAGKIILLASRILESVVNPLNTDSFWKNVNALNDPATNPPTRIDPSIKCRTRFALLCCSMGFPTSLLPPAISRASSVCTATATDSHICVVANPSWNVRLYAAAATEPRRAASLAQTEYAKTLPTVLKSTKLPAFTYSFKVPPNSFH